VRFAYRVAPITTADGDGVELGDGDGATDSGSDFLGALDAKAKVAVVITHTNEGFEAGALAGAGLLLHRHDLHHLVLQ
jgi:hypothetical protein